MTTPTTNPYIREIEESLRRQEEEFDVRFPIALGEIWYRSTDKKPVIDAKQDCRNDIKSFLRTKFLTSLISFPKKQNEVLKGEKYNSTYKKTGRLKGGGMVRDYNAALDSVIAMNEEVIRIMEKHE